MIQIKKKWFSFLLLIVMIVSMFPVQQVNAEPASIDTIGNTHITYDSKGNPLYQITVENGSLYIRGEYYSNSSALLSYHTEYTKGHCFFGNRLLTIGNISYIICLCNA